MRKLQVLLLLVVAALALAPGSAGAATTTRISVDSSEAQAAGGSSFSAAISADGRFVAFESAATILVAGDSNALNDVFVRDRTLGTTERVSVDGAELQATGGGSSSPAISADGRFVSFYSAATNLVADDSNALNDVFVRSFDDDGDFVHEYDDNCPDTANGAAEAAVLGVGDQADSDGDGVPGTKPPVGAAWGGDACDDDDDNDGKPDTTDDCRTLAEDYDGYQDGDGCPDTDNDLDGVVDAGDTGKQVWDPAGTLPAPTIDCKNIAEDQDGFKDGDGCPEPDNDNDGFPDYADNCPGTGQLVGPDGMLGAPQDLNHNGVRNDPPELAFSTDDVQLTFEDYDTVLDGDGCHDSPGDDFDGDGFTDEDEVFIHLTLPYSPDTDADTVIDGTDNCPNWANTPQNLPLWTVPANDSDCDGFTVAWEQWTGTDPTKHCNADSIASNEGIDAWPTDFNDNRFTSLADVVLIGPVYNQATGTDPATKRFDLNASGVVSLADVVLMGPFYNKSCS